MASNGPIEVVTIDGVRSEYDVRDYEITLKIKGKFFRGESLPKNFGLMLNNVLRAWRDGRRPLQVELMHDAFERICKAAISECISQEMQAKYGNEMVESEDGKRKTAKWYLEACKVDTSGMLPYFADDWEARVERQLTDEENKAFRDAINKSNKDLAS